eukprot:jgi/Chrzof1/7740/Cz02g35020.t1
MSTCCVLPLALEHFAEALYVTPREGSRQESDNGVPPAQSSTCTSPHVRQGKVLPASKHLQQDGTGGQSQRPSKKRPRPTLVVEIPGTVTDDSESDQHMRMKTRQRLCCPSVLPALTGREWEIMLESYMIAKAIREQRADNPFFRHG